MPLKGITLTGPVFFGMKMIEFIGKSSPMSRQRRR